MTRRKSIRPLTTAWVFVFVILGAGFIWLSLTPEMDPVPEKTSETKTHQQTVSGQDISLADTIAPTEKKPPDLDLSEHSQATAEPQHTSQENSDLPQDDEDEYDDFADRLKLTKAPIEGLTMRGAYGPLPVLGPDSMVSWKEYARPSNAEKDSAGNEKPKIAILVTGIGLNSKTSDLAIRQLPGQIDLGFSPYGRQLQKWMDKSREAGHEGFLMIPTEPLKYPENDPGPHTLLTGASVRDNLKKLDWLLSQVSGYVGIVNDMGSKFTASEPDILPILTDLKKRGLMFLDSRSSRYSVAAKLARRIAMPRAQNNLYIDNIISRSEIAKNLTTLENTARTYGAALGVARAYPLTIEELAKWARQLDARGIQLVPITAIANRQPIR